MNNARDVKVLRDLATQVAEIAAKDIQDERRDLWRRHNSLQRTRPLVYLLGQPFWCEVLPDDKLTCEDPLLRQYESRLRQTIFHDTLADDTVIEPWLTVPAVYATPTGPTRWGPEIRHIPSPERRGAWLFDPAIRSEDDLAKLVKPVHRIDEAATAQQAERLHHAVGDILPICVDRRPYYYHWTADISTDLVQLRGLEQFMIDMIERPAWLHRFLAFMRDAILTVQDEAEAVGDWRLCDHANQAMPYSLELPDPAADGPSVTRSQLWTFVASQETTAVSPAMFDEFMLQYQIPIMQRFGLSAYGCCEDLTHKIACLRKIPNLCRVSVTPWADLPACVEQIGTDYVISWRPSPAEMICNGFDPDRVGRTIRQALSVAKEAHIDICLKDVETIRHRPDELVAWFALVREIIDEHA